MNGFNSTVETAEKQADEEILNLETILAETP
ncbi:hypothetical protein PMIT1313_02185 [Prochlorococcus marinus str. MIT 1313]|nr:hypothetical protein PMIT1313_02185 [Prochlorococcus marinus str. MIT 1313]KZR71199.1 hypothetical protein PMIT1318_02342 [Prochlorococcus marinus str. MIT 1318]